MRLGLGTVQFGMDYGITNDAGKTPEDEVGKVLYAAQDVDERVLDTAALYGNSESIIGRFLEPETSFRIVTKTPSFSRGQIKPSDAEELQNIFQRSLRFLNQTKVHGLLCHNADNLLANGGEYLFDAMLLEKHRGKVNKVGVSVYTPEQAELLMRRYDLDIIQLPLNFMDQRFLKNGLLDQMVKLGIEVHSRSVFLQGVIFMDHSKLPKHLQPLRAVLEQFNSMVNKANATPLSAAISFVFQQKEVTDMICGVTTLSEWNALAVAVERLPSLDGWDELAIDDPVLIDPSNWKH